MDPQRSRPLFSVVMVTRAPAPWLVDALESVTRQSLDDWEFVCVLDGASTVVEEAVLRIVPNARISVLPNSSGVAAVRNEALRQARGDLVAVIDSDDVWPPEHLVAHAAAFSAHADLVLRGTGARLIDSEGLELGAYTPVPSRLLRYKLLFRNVFVHSSVAFRRSDAIAAGGYGADLQIGEDYSLWMRLATLGTLSNDVGSSISYRIHGDQTSRKGLGPDQLASLSMDRAALGRSLSLPPYIPRAIQALLKLHNSVQRRRLPSSE